MKHFGFKHQKENKQISDKQISDKQNSDKKYSHLIQCNLNLILYRILSSVKIGQTPEIGHHSREFRCR